MSLSPKEAAESLADAENAARRSARIYGYSKASPHLILWGAIWILGYGGTDLFHHYANLIWGVLILLGCLGGFLISRRCPSARDPKAPATSGAWRVFALGGIVFLFVLSTYLILKPTYGEQFAAFPALLTGAIYTAVGLWLGVRWILSGLFVIALTMGGFYLLPDHYVLWLAFVGGGGMMAAGFWFRTA